MFGSLIFYLYICNMEKTLENWTKVKGRFPTKQENDFVDALLDYTLETDMRDRERTTLHDLKDIVMIYSSPDAKADWDDADIVVWSPEEQKEYRLVFCGSTRPEDGHTILDETGYGKINFVIYPIESNDD